jgi:hypothetical protein
MKVPTSNINNPKQSKDVAANEITRDDIEAIMRNFVGEVHEDDLKDAVESTFAKQGRKLQPDWWEVTKINLKEWSKER